MMDLVDRAILNLIQEAFPIDLRPYQKIGIEIGISENEAFQRIEKLKKEKIIRRIGGIFDSRNLGYVSTLCAARVPEEKIFALTELMQGITEITHNYLRNHLYNMWFTVIAPSQERLEQILCKIRTALGSEEVYSLPALKIFKIEVRLNFLENNREEQGVEKTEIKAEEETEEIETEIDTEIEAGLVAGKEIKGKSEEVKNTAEDEKNRIGKFRPCFMAEKDKALIRILQDHIPDSITPFSDLGRLLGQEEEEILRTIRSFLERGIMRRLVAILYHQKAGFTSNVMGAWLVPEELVNEVGKRLAGFKEVSHCYQRPSLPDFPYNLFTMIHGHSDKECREIIAKMSRDIQINDYILLFSQTELKKSSMRYFEEKDDFVNGKTNK